LSLHSFTPVLDGRPRPWQVGVSHWGDRRPAALLIEALGGSGDVVVGDNAPYPIEDHIDYTLPHHGGGRGLPSVMIEIRQDGIRTPAEAAAWAARLAQAYRAIEPAALGAPSARVSS
jgi:predicted N-formylglutamate amidohydrolase